jgi:hypothetical protein
VSTFVDSAKSRIWLDGDAFRAPSLTSLPADIFAASLSGWSAFGGIKAGFTVTTEQDTTDVQIWNNQSGAPYRRIKADPSVTIAMRPVDYSVATVLTLLRGGSVVAAGGGFEMIQGESEEFALILRVYDGTNKKAYYVAKAELLNLPEENMGADDDVEGFDLEIGPLDPGGGSPAVRRILSSNPLA